jgi:hypothetical protein
MISAAAFLIRNSAAIRDAIRSIIVKLWWRELKVMDADTFGMVVRLRRAWRNNGKCRAREDVS